MRHLMLWIVIVSLAVSSGISWAQDAPVKIGFVGPITGDDKEFGEQARDGAQLLVDQLNAAGGINGRKVELIVKNDEGSATAASQVARELVTDRGVTCVVGHLNSRCTLSGAEMYNKGKLPQITYGSTNPSICTGRPYTFRNIYNDTLAGQQLSDFIKDTLKLNKVAIFYDNEPYGKGLAEAFRSHAQTIGLTIVNDKPYDSQANPDYRSILQGVMETQPEVLFVSGSGTATSTIAKIAKEMSPDVQLMYGDGAFLQSFIDAALDKAEGAIISGPVDFSHSEDPKIVAFVTQFREKYKREPSVWAFQAYDAAALFADVIGKVGSDREAVVKHMAGMTTPASGFTGITGNTYFDANGDPVGKPVSFFQVRNGTFELYSK